MSWKDLMNTYKNNYQHEKIQKSCSIYYDNISLLQIFRSAKPYPKSGNRKHHETLYLLVVAGQRGRYGKYRIQPGNDG